MNEIIGPGRVGDATIVALQHDCSARKFNEPGSLLQSSAVRRMNLSMDNSAQFLHARLSGSFSLEEGTRTYLEILAAVDRDEATKVLVDGRRITGEPKTLERFYYGSFVAEAVIALCEARNRPMPRFSYVLVPPVIDEDRFGNTVAASRGMDVKTFDDMGAALKWLGV
jgi:hypothetical protein